MAGKVTTVRFPLKVYERVKKVSGLRGEDMGTFIRKAVMKELACLSFLSEEEKKALGVS